MQLLFDLLFNGLKSGRLGFAGIVQPNDVVAELAFHGGGCCLAFFEFFQGVGKFGHIGFGHSPAQAAALCGRAFVKRTLFGYGIKRFACGQFGLYGAGFCRGFNEDVAGAVFQRIGVLRRHAGKHAVVFSLGFGIGNGVVFFVLFKKHGRQNGAARAGHFVGIFGR